MISDDNNSTRSVTTAELNERQIRQAIAENIRGSIPARVTRYDASQQQVDCQILIQDFHRDETGALIVASVPQVTNVPVEFASAGGFVFYCPIEAGDSGTIGWLHFAERSIDAWLSGQGQEVDPDLYTRFNLTDAKFTPGALPFGAALPGLPTDHAFAGKAGGVGAHFRDSTVCIGDESGSQFIALAQKVLDELSAIQTAFSLHTHTLVVKEGTSPPTTLTSGPAPTYSPSSVAATQAKAK